MRFPRWTLRRRSTRDGAPAQQTPPGDTRRDGPEPDRHGASAEPDGRRYQPGHDGGGDRPGSIDRRELLSLAFLRRPPGDDASTALPPEPRARPRLGIRPPGAVAEPAFVERCDACGRCLEACPFGSLVRLADGRPGVDPANDPCLLCLDVPCSRSCPTGALVPVGDARRVRIASAEIEPERCVADRDGSDDASPACRACFDACPLPHQALRWFGVPGRPDVSPSLCTGCGLCVRACPTHAITLHPR